MKWIIAAFLLLMPSASAEEVRTDNPTTRGLRRSATNERFKTSHANDGENKRKQRKKNREKSDAYAATRFGEKLIAIAEEETTVEAVSEVTMTSNSATNSTTPSYGDFSDSDGKILRSSIIKSSSITNPRVTHMYTYGSPSVVKGPAMSNPNNACIPGLRIYTEDYEIKTCSWWERMWCTAGGEEVTDVDFASQLNIDEGYPHPKMATLVLRSRDDGRAEEYTYRACRNYDDVDTYSHQWWPAANLDSDVMPGWNIHDLDEHYERRLKHVPYTIRGPSLEYVSVAKCAYETTFSKLRSCLNNYEQKTSSRIGGVSVYGWKTFAFMVRETDSSMPFADDTDTVYVLKKDQSANYRKCIIGFQGSDGASDLANFIFRSKDPTDYCGRSGVHTGVKNELWRITHDSQYANVIVPALETCHEVTCVGHSLGGSLCNLFTMCANHGLENLRGSNNRKMWDDYNSLIWETPS
mmetsp:Transcript_15049/g.28604  ORF Transcript_15049/g.28604 Transcript_15049/m.28604 type:complete len:466 (+) Transcript_15049:544-1941(+)|eukprot:CAMPEP_0201604676 /NCGR_PEP_ID=MMETSP0492-20130828/4741_1 /ASSEMBLY_ACC=CAM_ASM_000837 /TAXON_ID=420259 /ORGANISM="Thalassiosira gravida, Strain GMp14c1" /LENGTH=465 /DNA_ID=CAMNT_0048068761 /DNA_START=281 /DNA_END=1678 /DNA_ORIENTATION=+